MDTLEAISSIDGRYRRITSPLAEFFSEKALIENRIVIEGEYLIALSEHPKIGLRSFSDDEKSLVRKLYKLSNEDARIVKDIEVKGYKEIKPTNHDVKAVEYFMKDKLSNTSLEDSLEWLHFALTSEDTNNLAYGLMLSGSLNKIIIPSVKELIENINRFSTQYKSMPMLGRTHGQNASPTTVGKEFKVFSSRLQNQLDQLLEYNLSVKLNGAVGNYNAHFAAYPDVNWMGFTKNFITNLNENIKVKLKPNFVTTQIEPHDTYAELFDNIKRLNNVLIGFDQDMWGYVSDYWFKQKPVTGEVGSSTMPHKVNPIDFENSEGNLGMANVLFEFFSRKLPISRFQRDLSDSTVERNFGTAFAHSLIGYKSALKGLSKIDVNETKISEELEKHPEVIAEAIQTILRRERFAQPYEQLKELTRGKDVTMKDISAFIERLNIPDTIKAELNRITPQNYIGIAECLTEDF